MQVEINLRINQGQSGKIIGAGSEYGLGLSMCRELARGTDFQKKGSGRFSRPVNTFCIAILLNKTKSGLYQTASCRLNL